MQDEEDAASDKKVAQVLGLDRRQLIGRHISGDTTAFPELVSLYRVPVYTYMMRSGLDSATCDDLFQDAFMKVHLNAKSYDPGRPLMPWLFTIVVNTVRSHYRKEYVKRAIKFKSETIATEKPSPVPTADQNVVASETAERLRLALEKLPLSQREVVLTHCVQGMEQKDVALALKIPVATVKTLLSRARARLAHALLAKEKDVADRRDVDNGGVSR